MINNKIKTVSEMGTIITTKRDLLAESLPTLMRWVNSPPYGKVHEANFQEHYTPLMKGKIPASTDPMGVRRSHRVSCGWYRLNMMVLYAELVIETLSRSPHVVAMCYLLNAFDLTSRSHGPWGTLTYITNRFRKDIFPGEDAGHARKVSNEIAPCMRVINRTTGG